MTEPEDLGRMGGAIAEHDADYRVCFVTPKLVFLDSENLLTPMLNSLLAHL
ncbi:hypothetical protein [Nostoc sp.]|uniref:hypothetical protein n=1 Tax=Nostoc sp. TaxID=1180 RepID=UPI0035936B77